MASRTGGVVQDQNLNTHFNDASVDWKTNISKAPKKAVLGGRTPLGDLSNSLKPSLNQVSKKQTSGIFSFTEKETGLSKNALDATKKKISKASEKVQTSGRKALSDISNSGKPNVNEGLKKSRNAKLSVVAEEPIDANTIAEEQFLHNHQECIKVQARAMDLDHFLRTIGLDNGFSKQQEDSLSIKIKVQSPPRHLELEEMTEYLIDGPSWEHKLPDELDSPPPCRTPKSLEHYMDHDYNFKLLDSP